MPTNRGVLRLQGHIERLSFSGQPTKLPIYEWSQFDINECEPACKVRMPDGSVVALSRWRGPKRTRTYPLAKVYDTYSHNGKIVTVIPIVKDEGRGERKNDTNLDRINFITLSWMNLMNIYVILAWYEQADRIDDFRITNQKFCNEYIINKIFEISSYKMDAHHWNKQHFENEFVQIYECAIESYKIISLNLNVKMHSFERHERFLSQVRSQAYPYKLDIERFKQISLPRSQRSAFSEARTMHHLEQVGLSAKGLFEITNVLGGRYYLTADEVILLDKDTVLIQESKNSTHSALPSKDDIKDGLFKLLLFSQLSYLQIEGVPVGFQTRLRLTGQFRGRFELPSEESQLKEFVNQNNFSNPNRELLLWLNRELHALAKIHGLLEGSQR